MKKYSPTELFLKFLDEICPYNSTTKIDKEDINLKLNEFLESTEILREES